MRRICTCLDEVDDRRLGRLLVCLCLLCLTVVAAGTARAGERRFVYVYESTTLPANGRELEPWTTFRAMRRGYYARVDERLELELGLTDRLQSSWYLNFSSRAEGPTRQTTSSFDGISSEWKLKLSDPVADLLGSAAYAELSVAPAELEAEVKAIFDKRWGDWVGALNLVAAIEWELVGAGDVKGEVELEASAGLSYILANQVGVGVEVVEQNIVADGHWESAVILAGLNTSYAGDSWWATVAVLPQIVALRGATNRHLDLHDHERLQARLLFGWHL